MSDTATPEVVQVAADKRQQCGLDILVARCPRCQLQAALAGEGRHTCRGCHTLLEFKSK